MLPLPRLSCPPKPRAWLWGQVKRFQLDAVLNTTCAKCGTRGHFAKDCFSSGDGKTYALVTDADDVDAQPPPSDANAAADVRG